MKLKPLALLPLLLVLAGCSKDEDEPAERTRNLTESLRGFTKKHSESIAGELEKLGESLGEHLSEGRDAFTQAAEQALEDMDEQIERLENGAEDASRDAQESSREAAKKLEKQRDELARQLRTL